MRIFVTLVLLSILIKETTSKYFVASTTTAQTISSHAYDLFFGVARGGGLFGGKRDKIIPHNSAVVDGTKDQTLYPAMSKEEVERWLYHIPVFAVTDENGTGVVLRPENDTNAFYLYLSPVMANSTLETLKKSNDKMDLRVSMFSLGKLWFKVLDPKKSTDDMVRTVSLNPKKSIDDMTIIDGVNNKMDIDYRLVSDTRDLMGARMLLTMNKDDGKTLEPEEKLNVEDTKLLLHKAMTESPKFTASFNEIPIFMIYQMRMQKPEGNGDESEMTQFLPMYFSLQNMMETWQKCVSTKLSDEPNVEPAVYLMDLQEVVEKTQQESTVDYRNIVLVPPSHMETVESVPSIREDNDLLHQLGGDTLGDL